MAQGLSLKGLGKATQAMKNAHSAEGEQAARVKPWHETDWQIQQTTSPFYTDGQLTGLSAGDMVNSVTSS